MTIAGGSLCWSGVSNCSGANQDFHATRPIELFHCPVDLVAEFAGTFEGDDLALSEHEVGAGGGVSPPAPVFSLDAEFTESRNKYIILVFQCTFDGFQKRFDDFNRLFFGETQFVYLGNDVVFGQCHGPSCYGRLGKGGERKSSRQKGLNRRCAVDSEKPKKRTIDIEDVF
jgi:hypothetical protein